MVLDRLFRAPAGVPNSGQYAPKLLRPWLALLLITVAGVVGGWALFVGLARLVGADVSFFHPKFNSVPEAQLFDVVRSAATVAALIGGLYAILYAYRKQRVDEAAGNRADAEGLSKRYQDAAEQLGHDKAAVRLAGVYAMARLADEWPEQRQTCVDVLCAYMRMPPQDAPSQTVPELSRPDEGDLEVRRTITSVIAARLSPRSIGGLWSSCDFDLRKAQISGLVLRDALLNGDFDLTDAQFAGINRIDDVHVSSCLLAARSRISGSLAIENVTSDLPLRVSFDEVYIESQGALELQADWSLGQDGGVLSTNRIKCEGVLQIVLSYCEDQLPPLMLSALQLEGDAVFMVKAAPMFGLDRDANPDVKLLPIQAPGWEVGPDTAIAVPASFVREGVFRGSGWKGDKRAEFAEFYGRRHGAHTST